MGVYKVIANSNLIPEKNQHQRDNIFGQYVDTESPNTRSYTVIYLQQNLGFIINIRKSILHLCQKIEFLRMEIDLIKTTLPLTTEKVQKVVEAC